MPDVTTPPHTPLTHDRINREHRKGWRQDPRFLIEKVMGMPLWKAQLDMLFAL